MSNDDAIEAAQKLLEFMHFDGVMLDGQPISLLDLLDELACAGLTLVDDTEGRSSAAYTAGISGMRA